MVIGIGIIGGELYRLGKVFDGLLMIAFFGVSKAPIVICPGERLFIGL